MVIQRFGFREGFLKFEFRNPPKAEKSNAKVGIFDGFRLELFEQDSEW
jgi:hypothetical protein